MVRNTFSKAVLLGIILIATTLEAQPNPNAGLPTAISSKSLKAPIPVRSAAESRNAPAASWGMYTRMSSEDSPCWSRRVRASETLKTSRECA